MAAALQGLGFNVDKVLDGSLDQIENAVMRLKNRLSVSINSYGFFFYAGHGVQSNGKNYLIPIGANITSENSLRNRAVSVQWALSELNDASNELNVVVLDACRDYPFAWARTGNRGLTVISNQPADSIVVYATSAGSTAADVAQASERKQIPAVYSQFFGNAYLGSAPVATAPVQPAPQPTPSPQQSTAPVVQPAAQPAVTPPEAPAQYKIGDRGPAGGLNFGNGNQYGGGDKSNTNSVRTVRAF